MPTIATAKRVELDELLEFIRPRHRATLVTTRADGSPQLSLVTCGVDSAGRIVISTYPERAKAINLRRRPSASVCIQSDDWNGAYVQVDGEAEVIDLPDSVEPLVEYFRCISGEHPDWDEYRAAMVKQGKSLIRITPQRWGRSPPAGSRPVAPPELTTTNQNLWTFVATNVHRLQFTPRSPPRRPRCSTGGRRPVVRRARGALVAALERLRGLPGVEVLPGLPAGVDQVLVGALDRAQQLEVLEAGLVLHHPGAVGEPLLEDLAAPTRHGQHVDDHIRHGLILLHGALAEVGTRHEPALRPAL